MGIFGKTKTSSRERKISNTRKKKRGGGPAQEPSLRSQNGHKGFTHTVSKSKEQDKADANPSCKHCYGTGSPGALFSRIDKENELRVRLRCKCCNMRVGYPKDDGNRTSGGK